MNAQQLERRVKRLEEKVLSSNRRSLNESEIWIDFTESAFDSNLPEIMDPLFEYWGIDEGEAYESVDPEELAYLADEVAKFFPLNSNGGEMYLVNAIKFAKLVTKKFVEEGLIDKSFLRKPLPDLNLEELSKDPYNKMRLLHSEEFFQAFLKKYGLGIGGSFLNVDEQMTYKGSTPEGSKVKLELDSSLDGKIKISCFLDSEEILKDSFNINDSKDFKKIGPFFKNLERLIKVR